MTTYTLTTAHPASAYNLPVLVNDQGRAYGPGDVLPDGLSAADWAVDNLPDDEARRRFLTPLSPRLGRPRVYALGSRVRVTMDLPRDLIEQIDRVRGELPRNVYIAALLRHALNSD